jgi:hypothetical protein
MASAKTSFAELFTEDELAELAGEVGPESEGGPEPRDMPASEKELSVDLFYAYMPTHRYIFAPDGALWPAASVNPVVRVCDGAGKRLRAAEWLDRNRPVQQMTWAPGHPELIMDRLVVGGGWINLPGMACFNLYKPPRAIPGDPDQAGQWLAHISRVYPEDADHIIGWLAHRVQRPEEKINHALVLGGAQGIGKDTILEPVKHAVGPWNFAEINPAHLLAQFNPFTRSVVLRISEARDLGDIDRFKFYDHLKTYTAAPPDVLSCNEKFLPAFPVFNLCGVIITTNYKSGGIYLPADDRRHYVAWSNLTRADFPEGYWEKLYGWYRSGGIGHVSAFLRTADISSFDPKAPPRQTEAFWQIVDSSRAPEDSELADAIEKLGNPDALTLSHLAPHASADLGEWLGDRRNSRLIPHRMEEVGYEPVRNPHAGKDGRWVVDGKKQMVYARKTLCDRDRITAARGLRGRF